MPRRLLPPLAAIAVVVPIAAGCGDDDAGASAISRQDFIVQADKICGRTQASIRQEAVTFFSGGAPTPQQEQRFFVERAYPLSKKQDEAIRALGAPKGDEDEVKAMLDEADASLERVKNNPSVIKNLEASGPRNPFAKANALAKRYGLSTCAE